MTYTELNQKFEIEKKKLLAEKDTALSMMQNDHYAYLTAFNGKNSKIPQGTQAKMQEDLNRFEAEWKKKENELREKQKKELQDFLEKHKSRDKDFERDR